MIIARIESLILKKGVDDAVERARCYVRGGADGIMIHSKEKTPDEVYEFCERFRKEFPAMEQTAVEILKNGCSQCVDDACMPIKKVISFIPVKGE